MRRLIEKVVKASQEVDVNMLVIVILSGVGKYRWKISSGEIYTIERYLLISYIL
jgi:hypothetical protein